MGLERPYNGIALTLGERGGALTAGQEHRLAQVQAPDPQGRKAAAHSGEFGEEIILLGGRIETRLCQGVPAGRIEVGDPTGLVEDDDPLIERIEEGLRQGRKYRREGGGGHRLAHSL